ncbi:ClpP/crotonase [Lichtheimia hyalospora FSU 10163]|nr:ClpP/crotonase [Lichtheimia hyalospora FSU 10163]
MATPSFDNLEITIFPSGVTEIAFNRPKVLNSFSPEAYQDWLLALQWAKQATQVKLVVLTGRGRFYSSGVQLQPPDFSPEGIKKNKERRKIVKSLVDELILFPKLLIAAVNGPAYGFAVTTLALCDVVYAASNATFTTPFMKLGFAAEGCSSALFPRIMGPSKANEMLLMGKTLTVEEFAAANMVARIFPVEGFREQVLAVAEDTAKFSAEALAVTKKLTRDPDQEFLLKVNEQEMIKLQERNTSQDSIDSVMRFVREAEKKREAKRKAQQSKL